MSNQKLMDIFVRAQNCLHQRMNFEIRFEGSGRVDISQMRREGIPNRKTNGTICQKPQEER